MSKNGEKILGGPREKMTFPMTRIESSFDQGVPDLAALDAGDGFVLQDAHYHAPVLSLSFLRLIIAHLLALAHCTRGQHSGKRNLTLLYQDIGDTVGAIFTELLVQGRVSGGRGEALHLDPGRPGRWQVAHLGAAGLSVE